MILGVIPARGGSKGIPKKNLRQICGKPMITWSIQAAQRSRRLDDFLVSTDDEDIAQVARDYGAPVLMRPPHLAEDNSTTLSVLQHILEERDAEALLVLQPTSPVRDDDLIDHCIDRFLEIRPDNLGTGYHCKFQEYGSHDNLGRQHYPGFFYDDGNVYILSRELIRSGRWTGENSERFVITGDQNYEIDTELDLYLVERLLERRLCLSLARPERPLRLVATDVDGVLTDGGIYYSPEGEALKKFNTRDGKGLELVRKAGLKTAMITQETSASVAQRADKLKVDFYRPGTTDKVAVLEEITKTLGISLDQVAYIGDDLNDHEALKRVGFSATPQDGVLDNKRVVDFVCSRKGGEGCVREICDLILAAVSPDKT